MVKEKISWKSKVWEFFRPNKEGKIFLFLLVIIAMFVTLSNNICAFTPRYKYDYELVHINETEYLRLSENISVDKGGRWHIEILNYSGIDLDFLKIWTNIKHKTKLDKMFQIDERYENATVQNNYLLLDHGFNEIKIYFDNKTIYYGSMKVIKKDRTNFFLFFFLTSLVSLLYSLFEVIFKHWLLISSLVFFLVLLLSIYFFRRNKKLKRNRKSFLFILFLIVIILNSYFVFAIQDSNLSNNVMTTYVNISSTRNLSILFVPIISENYQSFNDDFGIVVRDHVEIINKTYPVADSSLIYEINSQSYLTSDPISYPHNIILFWLKFAVGVRLETRSKERIMGIFPNNFPLTDDGFSPFFKTAIGREQPYELSSHELAHTFQLCDEYSSFMWNMGNIFNHLLEGCPNANDNGVMNTSCLNSLTYLGVNYSGCLIEDESLIRDLFFTSQTQHLLNIMGDLPSGSTIENWVSKESYLHLFDQLDINDPPQFEYINVTIISGYKNKTSNTYKINNFYTVYGGYVDSASDYTKGEISLELLDSSLELISRFNFSTLNVSGYNGGDNETNISPFLFVVPFENISIIQFVENNSIVAQRNVTPNTPIVNITYPNGGEILENPFNITWEGIDADGDNIYYAVLISDDNGTNYTTLDIDLNQTYYELDPDDYDYGTNYVVKVLATDGVNTGNNVSNKFTLGNPFKITSLTNITINNTHMVFEFIINNTGETTLNNINWTLDPGDGSSSIKSSSSNTFNLTSGKSAFVYVEYNYSTESTFTVNATANSGTLSSSKQLNISLGNVTNNLDVYDFSMYNVSSTHKIFQFMIKNIATNENLTGISWSLNSGLETINSDYNFNLTPNNFSFVFVGYNYTQTGDFTPIASASSGSNQDSETLPTIDIPDIEASNLSLIYNDSTHRIFFFTISNMLSTPLTNVNWTFDTDDNNVISAEETFSLNSSKDAFIFIQYNYSSTGTYTVNATAINGSLQDSTTYGFTIT